jgi:phage tail-like protein
LRVWQIADPRAFAGTGDARGLQWRTDTRTLRLEREQPRPAPAEDSTFAIAMAQRPSPVRDAGGSYAWWNSATGSLHAAGFAEGSVPIPTPPDTPPGVPQPTDLAFGTDDVLYVARNDGVVMLDRRERWLPARVDRAGFRAQRLAPAAGGGVWALDRVGRRLARLSGYPLRTAGITDPGGESFRPEEPNPRPPRLRLYRDAVLPDAVQPIAVAASRGGAVAVLAWRAGADAELFTLEGKRPAQVRLVRRFALAGLRFPYALAWVGETRVAVMASDGPRPAAQAFVYELDSLDPAAPTGEVFRLLGVWNGGFCNTLAAVPDYPVAGADADTPGGVRKLHPLSRSTYAREGSVTLGPFDCGESGAVWHRLTLEATLPANAGLRIAAFADDLGAVPAAPGAPNAPDWSIHLAGNAEGPGDAPRAAWCAEPSELPFAPALHACAPEPGRSGLFTLLLQRPGRRVRRIEGRYLYLHLSLVGDSQVTPELAALRVYAQRFAWRDRYLPALYRETLAGPDADAAGGATPPDFLERFLGVFEGPLTQLEGRIADSWILTDPRAAPPAALPWLAQWIGLADQADTVPARLRQELRAAPHTARLHGTLGGLLAALEIATGGVVIEGGRVDPFRPVPRPGQLALATLDDVVLRTLVLSVSDPRSGAGSVVLAGGAVTRGEIVALEGFRLRRTFATILGADLADEDDPLTLGLATSGNSFVGDTLILGDAARREILAAFSAELQTAAQQQAVIAFFERLAHRTMVLVRRGTRTADLARLAAAAAAAAPAHVETTVLEADRPLIVGAASLVGVDTFLLDGPPVERVRVDRSRLGTGDLVMGEGRLDARAEGPFAQRPRAVADGPSEAWSGTGFVLSAARSEAAAGRVIERNIWTWI